MDKGAIGSFDHRFHSAYRTPFFQNQGHWTFVVGQRPTVGPIQLPSAAELARSYLGAATP